MNKILLMNTGNACMASLLITCAYKEWRHEKGSRLESCLLAGSVLGPLGLILYVHKNI